MQKKQEELEIQQREKEREAERRMAAEERAEQERIAAEQAERELVEKTSQVEALQHQKKLEGEQRRAKL